MTLLVTGANSSSSYQISRSVRLRQAASAYFNRTPSSNGNRQIMTFSFWMKRGLLNYSANYLTLFSAYPGSSSIDTIAFSPSSDSLRLYLNGSVSADLITTQVFRDPSAWYHVVVAIDTTQATASNRIKMYVNGSQITSFSTLTYPTQNYNTYWNSTSYAASIGANLNGPQSYFDGYLTEINFIDGQALTPSSFGATSTTTGVWTPIKYAGTYGTNGFYLPFTLNSSSTYGASFNGSSQYLTTSTNSSLALGTNSFTVEYWIYIASNTGGTVAVSSGNGTSTYDGLFGYQTGSQSIILYLSSTGSSWDIASGTTIGSTPTGTWNHVAITRNGSTFYTFVNGVQGATFTSSASLYQSANSFAIGRAQSGTILNGYLSNVRVIVGTALYTSNFVPPTTALTAVTNTKLLTLQNATIVDNSTNALTFTNTGSVTTSTQYPFANPTIGADASGNANDWSPNNINVTTTGATYDSMVDTPIPYGSDSGVGGEVRGNYCVMNPVAKNSRVSSITANLQVYGDNTANHQIVYGTFPMTTGKWYWEATINNPGSPVNIIGIQSYIGFADGTYCGSGGNGIGWGYSNANGNFYASNFTTSGTAPALPNGTIGIAYNADAGKIWFRTNTGSWVQGDPAAGTSPTGTLSGTATTMMPAVSFYVSNGAYDFNFGQRAFAYTAPSGFKALNTQNLSTPTIANGAGYMAATLYTGTGSSQTIANTVGSANFQPDLVWVKSRSAATDHKLTDSVRGVTKGLISDTSGAETTDTNGLTAFGSTGFTLGTDTNYNNSGATYVGWNWKAGGTAVSNTSGTITSSVSANTTAGFSVVSYTGNATAGATVGHGLGVAPSMVIAKYRGGVGSWAVYHSAMGATNWILLNGTAGQTTSAQEWNNTAPTSTVFTVGNASSNSNQAGTNIAYCWTPIAGYSAFGSYTGNASTDGPFVYTGFRPRWVMVKRSDSTSNWYIWDTSRDTYNVEAATLLADTSGAETSATSIDDLSNGFKCRSATVVNASGGTYVYAAFAENPFKYALAR